MGNGLGQCAEAENGEFLYCGKETSLYVSWQSDRRNSLEQEGKLFYATRPTRECFVLISMPNSIPKRRNYSRLAL